MAYQTALLRGLYGISDCSPWGKKSQRAAVIPSGAPSAWMALLSDYYEGGQLQPDGPEHPHSVLAVPYILAIPFSPIRPIHPGRPIHSWSSHTSWPSRRFPTFPSPVLRLFVQFFYLGMEPSTCVRHGTIGYRTDGLFQIANTP